MLTAQQAREKAKQALIPDMPVMIANILKRIDECTENGYGRYSNSLVYGSNETYSWCSLLSSHREYIVKNLKALGYSIEYYRNELLVSW
jgi:hypothetical protein